ncbi:hypothetical protein NPIL_160271 [Nephila pilipes]|uniref:Uncharacterized protein n=1 Tax=Nephila pilipes TaxID=299642 RepID=A0A8X6PRD9_NEPPI|nr:hypothetical protein NPIL_160271 [Nephila pilipes]
MPSTSRYYIFSSTGRYIVFNPRLITCRSDSGSRRSRYVTAAPMHWAELQKKFLAEQYLPIDDDMQIVGRH